MGGAANITALRGAEKQARGRAELSLNGIAWVGWKSHGCEEIMLL